MGLPSAAWYDELLLEKVKTLIEAAMSKPGTSRGATNYEQFVKDLDVEDHFTRRAVESIINQTASRKPGSSTLRRRATDLHRSNAVRAANRESFVLADLPTATTRVVRRSWATSNNPVHIFGDESSSSSSSSEETEGPREAIFRRRIERRQRAVEEARANRQRAEDRLEGRDGAGEETNPWAEDDAAAAREGLDWLTFDAEASVAQAAAEADQSNNRSIILSDLTVSPEEALRRLRTRSDAISNELPTLSDVWRAARECPLPVDVHSLDELVLALNASERSHPNYEATTLATLVAELNSRDPAAGIRLRNMVRHRRARGAIPDTLNADERAEAARTRRREASEPLWRAYVADLDASGGRGASRLYEHLPPSMGSAGENEGAFEAFARRRRMFARLEERARARGSEGEGTASERAPTPFAGEVADTPASSVELSPAQPADCPPSPPPASASAVTEPARSTSSPAPAPLTSADLAEQFARARRSIAPMPQRATATASPGPAAVAVAELNRLRLRRVLSPILRDDEVSLREAAMAAAEEEEA